MRHPLHWITSFSLLLCAAPLRAAEGAQARDSAGVSAAPAAKYQSLVKEFESARSNFSQIYGAARTEADRKKALDQYPRAENYAARFLRLADQFPNDPAGLDALIWIATAGRDTSEASQAFQRLANKYITSDKLGPVCATLIYSTYDGAQDLLAAVLEKNPHREVQGQAAFSLGQYLKERKTGAENEAEKYFERVIGQYGDLKHYRGTLADAAKGELFEMRNLGIGKVAPEIEGEDADGKRFKLGDYRGRVVVLDFWGDW